MSNEFYIAIKEASINIPGDERSKSAPGHGYPAHSFKYPDIIELSNMEAVRDWISEQGYTNTKNYRLLKCTELQVFTKVSYQIEEKPPEPKKG